MDRLHLLTDNQDISDGEYDEARSLLSELRTLHFSSRQYLEHHGRVPDTFLPGNIWAEVIQSDHFTDWTYDLVNYAKCVSPFTGFDSMMWGRRDTPGQVDVAKANDFYIRFLTGELGYKDDGTLHIAGGDKVLDYHVDAVAEALRRFPNHTHYPEAYIEGHLVVDRPNTFIRYPFDEPRS